MDVKVLEKNKSFSRFIIKDIDYVVANTLRRTIVNNVPTMAIEDVNFLKNSSAMFDEFIAHRLGMVVLKTDLKSYTMMNDCRCKGKGCARCQLHFKLKAKGPRMVYAEDLSFKDSKIKPVYPKTPIVLLLKKQDLELEGVAVLGEGKDHMKFSPGLVFYQGFPIFDIRNCKASGKCVEFCPPKILRLDKGKIRVTDPEKCILCNACVEVCKNKAMHVKGSDKDFIFTIESWGQLDVKEMVSKAVDVFDNKLAELDKLLKKALK